MPHGLYMMGTGQQASEGGGTSFLPWEHQRTAPGADVGRPGGIVAPGMLCDSLKMLPLSVFIVAFSIKLFERPFCRKY